MASAIEPVNVETPNEEGPAADPALLAQGGATDDAGRIGISMAFETMQKYGKELEQDGQKLMQTALSSMSNESGQNQTSRRGTRTPLEKTETLLSVLLDTSDSLVPSTKLVEAFATSSVLLTAFALSSVIGSYLFGSIISLFIPHIGAALISSVILPIAVGVYVKGQTQLDGIQMLLGLTALQGLLSGSAFSSRYVTSEPFVIVSSIVGSFALTAVNRNDRISTLSAVVAASLGAHSLIGLLEGSLSVTYLTLSLLYTLAVVVPVQLSVADKEHVNTNLYATIIFGTTVAAKTLIYAMAGFNANEALLNKIEQIQLA